MAKPTKDNRKSVVDFGVGWVVIIYCLLMFFLYVGMCNDGANITAPNVAYRLGLEQGDIMNMNSLAGLVGVVFFIIAGQVNRKIGARMTSGICCIISGIAYILACNRPQHRYLHRLHVLRVRRHHVRRLCGGGTLWPPGSPKRRAWLWAIPPWATTSPPLSMCSW